MKDFSYRSMDEQESLESILKVRKQKIARQQIIFSIILSLIGLGIGYYVFRKVTYTEFYGYIKIDQNEFRTPSDIFLQENYVEIGDLVVPGDTLYSYIDLNMLLEHSNMNDEPEVVTRSRKAALEYKLAQQDLNVLKVRIKEIKHQIAILEHNIKFGLTDNSHKLEKEKELAETEEQLKSQLQKVRILQDAYTMTNNIALRSGYNEKNALNLQDLLERKTEFSKLYQYYIINDSAIITQIHRPSKSILFKAESVITAQNLNLKASNLRVTAYIPVNKMNRINKNTQAEVIVNDDIQFPVKVAIIGTRTEAIPENLRSSFSNQVQAVIADFEIAPEQILPYWTLTDNLPVIIRINNFAQKGQRKDDYIQVKIGKGVIYESVK